MAPVKPSYMKEADAWTGAPLRLAPIARESLMGSQIFGRVFVTLALLGCVFYGYQYAMTQGVKTLIAAQPPMPKLAPAPSFDFGNCDLGITTSLYGQDSGPYRPPCRFDPPPAPPKIEPVVTMSKADSEKVGFWFILAAIGLPLGLFGVAAFGYWVISTAVGQSEE